MTCAEIIKYLKSQASPRNVEGMARFGINPRKTLGVNIPILRKLARTLGKNHELAQKLWKSGIHEAKILAAFIDEPALVTSRQMDSWVKDFDSWDVCDQVCSSLFDKTPYAWQKAKVWTKDQREFVRRAGFAMMAVLAVHDKKAKDADYTKLFPLIKKYSSDERNFVRKAVNWALRQIGKRNARLRRQAIKLARQIKNIDSPAARWIAADALKELTAKK